MRSIPIIAMTANAMETDKEACRVAGMVDHVSKPIDLDILIATILRHVSARPADSVSPTPPLRMTDSSIAPAYSPDTEAAVEIDLAIKRLGGSRELYDMLVESFQDNAAELIAKLHQHVEQTEYTQARLCAHTLKGTSATVGATALAKLSGRIESILEKVLSDAATLDASALTEAVASLSLQFSDTIAALPQRQPLPPTSSSTDAQPASDEDYAALGANLAELAICLQHRDMSSTKLGASLRLKTDAVGYGDNVRQQMDALSAALDRLDFAHALAICSSMQGLIMEIQSQKK